MAFYANAYVRGWDIFSISETFQGFVLHAAAAFSYESNTLSIKK